MSGWNLPFILSYPGPLKGFSYLQIFSESTRVQWLCTNLEFEPAVFQMHIQLPNHYISCLSVALQFCAWKRMVSSTPSKIMSHGLYPVILTTNFQQQKNYTLPPRNSLWAIWHVWCLMFNWKHVSMKGKGYIFHVVWTTAFLCCVMIFPGKTKFLVGQYEVLWR